VIKRWSRIRSYALAFAAIGVVIAFFDGPARSEPANERARCETQAGSSFQELTREHVSVLESLNLPFEIISNQYQAAYSEKLSSCLLLIRKRMSIRREISDTSYLIDATSRNMYALYAVDGGAVSCMLIPSIKETKACKSRREFDDFVGKYLK